MTGWVPGAGDKPFLYSSPAILLAFSLPRQPLRLSATFGCSCAHLDQTFRGYGLHHSFISETFVRGKSNTTMRRARLMMLAPVCRMYIPDIRVGVLINSPFRSGRTSFQFFSESVVVWHSVECSADQTCATDLQDAASDECHFCGGAIQPGWKVESLSFLCYTTNLTDHTMSRRTTDPVMDHH